MADEIQLVRTTVSKPDSTGKRAWAQFYKALNFNANVPLSTANSIRNALRPYGTVAMIEHIALEYWGDAGKKVQPGFYASTAATTWTDTQVTTDGTTDHLCWLGQWPIELADSGATYDFWVVVTGYAATDDLYVTLSGTVWP